jgi:hypothetical protein
MAGAWTDVASVIYLACKDFACSPTSLGMILVMLVY